MRLALIDNKYTGLIVTEPAEGQCVDLTKGFTIQWIPSSDDQPTLSFHLWNAMGAVPPVDEPIPIGDRTPAVINLTVGS
ncbi:hypothetical protein PENVUL_c130G07705 [Penicillium vulpinum]|uniref:Uncharacterized protein n=1 Tax=Penicillium vulpinum TaxID=29845 RepID=A0A1V6R0K8_9EURO|nr:hypothetical protein PENVUL_c130G07705 [Penicillium vulpinum]